MLAQTKQECNDNNNVDSGKIIVYAIKIITKIFVVFGNSLYAVVFAFCALT
jgi:hypothetical protein